MQGYRERKEENSGCVQQRSKRHNHHALLKVGMRKVLSSEEERRDLGGT